MSIEPLEFLYLALGVAVIILVVLLAINLIYLIPIMRNTSKITKMVRHTSDAANKFVMKPISLASGILDKAFPIIEKALEKRHKDMSKGKKKKKNRTEAKRTSK